MAKPIRNTPILSGQDAEHFFSEINDIPSIEERSLERKRISTNANRLRKLISTLKQD